MGFKLMLVPGGFGHELGEYMHDRRFRFYNSTEIIENGRWILEILISDEKTNRWAFYENVILDGEI